MVRLYAKEPVKIPDLDGVTVTARRSRSFTWSVQYDVTGVPLHLRADEHTQQVVSALRDAGALDGSAAALMVDEVALRLRTAVDVEQQVSQALAAVAWRYDVQTTPLERWTYYAGLRVRMRHPFPDVTTLALQYLESAEDLTGCEQLVDNLLTVRALHGVRNSHHASRRTCYTVS